MNIRDTLEQLCAAQGVSGAEDSAARVALRLLSQFADHAYVDDFHCVIGEIGNDPSKKTLLLDAHIDQIGLIVTYLREDGFLKVAPVGGIDIRTLPAQTVTIHGKEKIKGIISTLPPHVQTDEKKAVKIEDTVIDTGLSYDRLKEVVSLGDLITLDGAFCDLLDGRVSSPAMDDRSGVAAILYALYLTQKKDLKFNIKVLFSCQEEVGCRGAKMGAFTLNPDYAVAVDVSFGRHPEEKAVKTGIMGDGAMIGIAPTLDREVYERLTELAKQHECSYQFEIMNGKTGTNADEISVTKCGVKTGLLSIPLRYMHTPVETVQLSDIESVAKLLAAFMTEGIESNQYN